jgi:hypothetical protein
MNSIEAEASLTSWTAVCLCSRHIYLALIPYLVCFFPLPAMIICRKSDLGRSYLQTHSH